MKRILIFLLIAVVLARAYDVHTQLPQASISDILTMLAPLEVWLGVIVLWSALLLIRKYL
jgi:hypothetical protein